MKIFKLLAIILAAAVINPNSAVAATSVTGGPYSNLALTGQVITLKLTSYPTNAGFYIIECARTNGSSRPKYCNSASQLWISSSPGANFAPSADILFRPTATFNYGSTAIDCLKMQCGIFIRLDHMSSFDSSEDQFIPISFVGGISPSLPNDIITASVNRRVLKSDEALKVEYNDSFTVFASSRSGAPLTMSTSSTGCSVTGTTVRILRGFGYCDLTISSPGTSQYASVIKHYYFKMTPADQSIAVSTNVKAGTSLVLPALSNVGAKVTYDLSSTGNCSMTTNTGVSTLTFNKVGSCRIRATAPALTDAYTSMKKTISFKVR